MSMLILVFAYVVYLYMFRLNLCNITTIYLSICPSIYLSMSGKGLWRFRLRDLG